MTATGPLAPVHFTINWSYNIPFALMAYYVLRRHRELGWWTYFTMVMIAETILSTSIIPVWLFLFQFSATQTAGLWLWGVLMGIPQAILGFYFVRYVARAGVLAT